MQASLAVDKMFDKSVNFVKNISKRYGKLPWVIGFSGGKDSTAVVHVVVEAIKRGAELSKVYVVYEDTLLEHPLLKRTALEALASLRKVSQEELEGVVEPVVLKPAPREDFISMIVLKGYPAPGPRFRWCTRVLKLNPLKNFARSLGEFVMVSGVRLNESSYRKANLKSRKLAETPVAEISFAGAKAIAVMPILTWSDDDVFRFLSRTNRWDGKRYYYIFELYGFDKPLDAIPLTVRYGCWVCTVVTKEKTLVPEALLKAKEQLLYIAKKEQQYREKKYGKLNIEGRKAIANVFLQALRNAPEAFGYDIEKLEKFLKLIIDDYEMAANLRYELY